MMARGVVEGARDALSLRPGAKLFGRRSGKALAPYQHALLSDLLPSLAVDVGEPLDPSTLFSLPRREIWLEVGFGGGEHLLSMAAAHPHVGLIGCEPFINGMARALSDIAGRDVDNVRLFCGDAGEIVDALPTGSLSRVFILYPDPWPKRRQRKRRLVSVEMLARLARVMRPGAELRLATDVDDYCGWMLSRLLRSPDFAWTARCSEDWRRPWPGWVGTRYESKARDAGRRCSYLTAVRR